MCGLRFILAAAVAALLLVPLACGDGDDATSTAAATDTLPAESTPTEPTETVPTEETTTGEAAPPPLPSDPAAAKAVVA